MRWILRAGGAGLITAAACIALAATPAAAAARSPLATITRDVHAATAALTTLSHATSHHSSTAKRALARNRSAIAAAAREFRGWKGHTNTTAVASALTMLAKQYGSDAHTYAALVPKATGSLQTQLASSIKPALDGQTIATSLLGELTSLLPSSGATSASGTIGGLLGGLPSLIGSLTGMVNGGGYSQEIQMILSGALTTASGLLDAGINLVQKLLPNLPAGAQTTIEGVLTEIQSAFTTFECALNQALQTITTTLGGSSGSMLSGELSQLLSLLSSFFGGTGTGSTSTGSTGTGTGTTGDTCPASTGTGSTGTGTGSTGTGSTGTGTTGTGPTATGILSIPSFIQQLLQQLLGGFGLGGLPFGLAADHG